MKGWEQTKVLPPKLLKMVPAKDRAEMGKAGQLPAEIDAKNAAKLEKELHRQLLALLQEHRGIVVLYSRLDRKTTTVPGTPDFIFAIRTKFQIDVNNARWTTYAVAWELKVGTNSQDPDQVEMERKMTTGINAWRYRVIRSVAQAREELAQMGL